MTDTALALAAIFEAEVEKLTAQNINDRSPRVKRLSDLATLARQAGENRESAEMLLNEIIQDGPYAGIVLGHGYLVAALRQELGSEWSHLSYALRGLAHIARQKTFMPWCAADHEGSLWIPQHLLSSVITLIEMSRQGQLILASEDPFLGRFYNSDRDVSYADFTGFFAEVIGHDPQAEPGWIHRPDQIWCMPGYRLSASLAKVPGGKQLLESVALGSQNGAYVLPEPHPWWVDGWPRDMTAMTLAAAETTTSPIDTWISPLLPGPDKHPSLAIAALWCCHPQKTPQEAIHAALKHLVLKHIDQPIGQDEDWLRCRVIGNDETSIIWHHEEHGEIGIGLIDLVSEIGDAGASVPRVVTVTTDRRSTIEASALLRWGLTPLLLAKTGQIWAPAADDHPSAWTWWTARPPGSLGLVQVPSWRLLYHHREVPHRFEFRGDLPLRND